MPEYIPMCKLPPELDDFTRSYLETAEWCDISEDDRERFELLTDHEWDADALRRAIEACKDFQQANEADLGEYSDSRGGHDFWLTRNRHGAGFWDGDWPEPAATRLTDNAHAYGEVWVYLSDDDTLCMS